MITEKIDEYLNEGLSEDDFEYIDTIIEKEGFEQAFLDFGSSFKNIQDKKFHALRKKFIKATNELKGYIY